MLRAASRDKSRQRDQRTRYEDLGGPAHRGGDHTEMPALYDRPMRRAIVAAAALLAAAPPLSGCGHTTTVGAGRTVAVALTEYRVRPQSVQAAAGELTIVVHNYGRLTHNLVVSSQGQVI